MQCPVCGTSFEGHFCPQCGTRASPGAAGPVACYRCGTGYVGNFCPACGAPAPRAFPIPAYFPAPMPPRPSTAKVVLSYIWVLGLGLFFVLLASNFATLYVVTPQIVDGIQQVRTGSTVNAGLDAAPSDWAFVPLSASANGSWDAVGGDPGGFLRTVLPGTSSEVVRGYWVQSFAASGSSPYAAVLRFEYRVEQRAAGAVAILVFVGRNPGPPVAGTQVFGLPVTDPAGWTAATQRDPSTGEVTARIDVGSAMGDSGMYFLKVLVEARYLPGDAGTTVIGLDNLQLRWGTNAGLVLFLIVPFPQLIAQTRDPGPFTAYFALIAIALVASAVYQLAVDARPLSRLMTSPPQNLGGRLRARVGVVAVAQTFFAVYFFQVVFILILNAFNVPTPSPLTPSESPRWFLVYELANASVWEEVITRVMMIGLPMFAASLALRARRVVTNPEAVRGGRARYVLGSLRFLFGGTVTRDSPMSTLVAGGVLLAISSAIFGLAHAPGYGDWKVIPAALAGLGLGYLYLRHGLAAAILFHFATDYFFAIVFAVPDPGGWGTFLDIVLLGVLVLGAGFFAYYILYTIRLGGHLVARARGGPRPAAAPGGAAPAWSGGPAIAPPTPAPAAPATLGTGSRIALPPNYSPPGRPPPYGIAPVQFRCARCGWIEARYDQGRFTCLRCGHTP